MERLVGFIRLLDDTKMQAQVPCVLVHPDCQGCGMAGSMISMIEHYEKTMIEHYEKLLTGLRTIRKIYEYAA